MNAREAARGCEAPSRKFNYTFCSFRFKEITLNSNYEICILVETSERFFESLVTASQNTTQRNLTL